MSFYLDASALVKRVRDEPESVALRKSLRASSGILSSELALAEVPLAVRRRMSEWPDSSWQPATANVARAFEDVAFVPVDRGLLLTAGWFAEATLRTLDAIHLAAALSVRDELAVFVSYDWRQLAAARRAGLPVASPA